LRLWANISKERGVDWTYFPTGPPSVSSKSSPIMAATCAAAIAAGL
jgi:hypothetical protein